MEELPEDDSYLPNYAKKIFQKSETTNRLVKDLELCDIYHNAIVELLDLQHDENAARLFRSYLVDFDKFADDWCQLTKTNIEKYDKFMDILEDSLYYRIVYVYRNALLLSSAVSLHFSNVLAENPLFSQRLLQKNKTLRICSIGGGSASDVVAIISVLERIVEDLDIRVTIIDRDSRWKITSLVLLRCLKTFRSSTWKINFVTCELSEKSLTPEAIFAIENADVVTMVKFISEFHGPHKKLLSTIKNIIEYISPGSIVFVLDVADNDDYIEKCGNRSGEVDNCQLIYEEICYLHTLELNVVEKVILMYRKYFSALQINSSYEMFVRVWLKTQGNSLSKTSDRQLQMRFRRNLDQYNLHETLLNSESFKKWREEFSLDMERMGWSQNGIRRVQLITKLQMDEIRDAILESKRKMDALINTLETVESVGLEKSSDYVPKIVGQFSDEAWEQYSDLKYDFVCFKEIAYKRSVLSLYNHMTRRIDFNIS